MASYFGLPNGQAGDASALTRGYYGLGAGAQARPTSGQLWPRGTKTSA